MSKPVNPMAIGSFLLGGIVLLVAGLLVFGGGQMFKERRDFVIYFDSSLNGLNVGAPVKLQGVQIGTVKSIVLQMDPHGQRVLKPVIVEFEPEKLVDLQGHPLPIAYTAEGRRRNAQRLIEAGLRARLEMQSLLTGLLFVEFNFYPDKPARLMGIEYEGLPELPSIPTATDELKNTAEDFIKQVRKMPLEQIVNDLSTTLNEIRDIVKSDETQRTRKALTRTLEEMDKLVATLNQQTAPLMRDTHDMVRDLRADIRPVLSSAQEALRQATTVLQESRGAVASLAATGEPDAPLQQALVELRDAARSIRDLTDYLERHPDSVLYGKP